MNRFLVLHRTLVSPARIGLIGSCGLEKPIGHLRRELPQLVAHHILCNRDIVIDFPIVYLKFQADEVW